MADYHEVRNYPLSSVTKPMGSKRSKFLPLVLITAIKDFLQFKRSKKSNNYKFLDSSESDLTNPTLIWEHHDLFPGIGTELANKYGIPLIKYVHAPQVWEAKKWGVKRPVWGKLLEKSEVRNLNRADLVACVSAQVYTQLIEMGVNKKKLMVSPMAVDRQMFLEKKLQLPRSRFGLDNKITIGWTGSFRKFHGLELLVESFEIAYKENDQLCLVLIGDGFEKQRIENIIKEKDLSSAVVFIGKKKFKEIPAYIKLFDIAIVSAHSTKGFHYSPLKLREYLITGLATLAPRAGEVPEKFKDNEHVILYDIGDVKGLANKMTRLSIDTNLRRELGSNGKQHVLKAGTWKTELEKALAFLG